MAELNLPDTELSTLNAMVDHVRFAHFRLVWIAGGDALARSSFLERFASEFDLPLLKIGRLLSSSLLDQPVTVRSASAESAFYEILASAGADTVCIDHLDILFDEGLMLKAVDLVRNASRRYILLASWPGIVEHDHLTYGLPDHPSFFRIPLSELECHVHQLSIP